MAEEDKEQGVDNMYDHEATTLLTDVELNFAVWDP